MSHPFSNLTVFIAMRYAWGSGVMSYVSKLALAGLVLSITVLVLVISVVNGFDRELRDRVLALLPHVSISSDQGIPADHPLMLTELPAQEYIGLHLFAKKVAQAIDIVMPCARVGSAVVGLEVPHAHIHLIPINEIGDISFQKEKLQLSPTKMLEIANSISEAFSQL